MRVVAVADDARIASDVAAALLGTVDGVLLEYDLRSATGVRLDADESCVPASSAFLGVDGAVGVACREGPVRRLTRDAGSRRDLDVPYGGAGAITVSPDGGVVIGAANGMVYTSDPGLGALEEIGSSVELGPTFWRVVTVSGDGDTILLTGNGTGKIGHMYIRHRDGDDRDWYTIDLPAGEAQQSRAAAVSADGRVAAVGSAGGAVHYFSLADGNPGLNRTEVSGAVAGLAFDGGRVVAATRDGVVDEIDGCRGCESAGTLVGLADRRLAAAARFGLGPR